MENATIQLESSRSCSPLENATIQLESSRSSLKLGHTKAPGKYSRNVHELRGRLRQYMNAALVDMTGDTSAVMWWQATRFHKNVFQNRRLRLVGWPSHIRFSTLSEIQGGKKSLMQLLDAWDTGVMHFARVSDEEVYKHATDIAYSAPGPFDSPGRSYVKKSRFTKTTGKPLAFRKKHGARRGASTPRYVTDEMDRDE